MPTRRARITFAGWQLGAYGGMESRVFELMDLAAAHGYAVELRTGRPIPAGTPSAARAARFDAGSVLGDWQGRPAPRAALAVVRAGQRVRFRRPLTARERERAGHGLAKRAIDRYWPGPGGAVLGRTDVLHLFGPPMPFLVGALRAAHAAGVPTLYQVSYQSTSEFAANKWRRDFIGTCNLLDLLLVNHPAQADAFAEHFGYTGERVVVGQWAYGIEGDLLALAPSRADQDPIVIGTLARFDQVKRLDLMVRALAGLDGPDGCRARLRLGGTGAEEEAVRRLAVELGVADRVEFAGFVADKVAFYRDVDCFLIASDHEGGPNTGPEAMAAGRAVVSTRVGGMPRHLGEGDGILVEPGDLAGITAALQRVVDDPALRLALGERARRRYLATTSAAIHEAAALDLWATLAHRSPRASQAGGSA